MFICLKQHEQKLGLATDFACSQSEAGGVLWIFFLSYCKSWIGSTSCQDSFSERKQNRPFGANYSLKYKLAGPAKQLHMSRHNMYFVKLCLHISRGFRLPMAVLETQPS